MVELPPPGEEQRPAEETSDRQWDLVVPHRRDLLTFARTMGAGTDAEDVVHEALLTAAQYKDLDEHRVWSLLATITARRIADHYRRAARAQILVRHRALVPSPRLFEHEVADRAEAAWLADQLVKFLRPEIMDLLWRHHVGGATWAELAAEGSTSADALKQRVSRALLNARRRIGISPD